MTDESRGNATTARPVARPKARSRYQPEPSPPAHPVATGSAHPATAGSARPVKAEPSPAGRPGPAAPAATEQPRGRGWPSRLRRPATIYTALVAAAAIFAGYALVAWAFASNDSASFAKARDAVLLAARQDIVVLNQLDYRNIDQGLKRWLDATTGDLHEQLANVSPSDKKDIATAKKISSGKVIDAAVTELDNRAGTATVIATVETTVSPSNGAPPKRNRFEASLERVGSGWKVSGLDQVAVNMS